MIISLLKRALMMSTPLLFGSIAEVIAERSGMMVTAIEGIFLMGAWGGFVGTYLTGSAFIGILAAILSGLVAAAVYGVVCIYLKQHQVVTGTAINVLAAGICTYLQRVLFGVPTAPLKISPLPEIAIPILSQIPVIGPVFFQQNILTYVVYLLIPASYFLLFKTSFGLTIRSTGENPEAVDVAGINVNAVRFFTVLLAGVHGRNRRCILLCGIFGNVHHKYHWRARLDRICHMLFGQLESKRSRCWNRGLRAYGSHRHLYAVGRRGKLFPQRIIHCNALSADHCAHRVQKEF